MLTIGIPRALLYYDCGPIWADFYRTLGAEVIISDETTKDTMDLGVSLSVDDACLPVKVYHGHAAALARQCDYLFVPRLVSVERKTYMCPKYLGLPDMIRAMLGDSVRLISPTIDLSRSKRAIVPAVVKAASVATRNPVRAACVWRSCVQRQSARTSEYLPKQNQRNPRIGVLAHPYVIGDQVLSMSLLDRLCQMGISPVLSEDVEAIEVELHASALGRHVFWTHERRMYGAGMSMASSRSVLGIIIVQAFGCGPGSMIFDLLIRRCRRASTVPILSLSIDEHTGEAGIVTRLEAFVDMLMRSERDCL